MSFSPTQLLLPVLVSCNSIIQQFNNKNYIMLRPARRHHDRCVPGSSSARRRKRGQQPCDEHAALPSHRHQPKQPSPDVVCCSCGCCSSFGATPAAIPVWRAAWAGHWSPSAAAISRACPIASATTASSAAPSWPSASSSAPASTPTPTSTLAASAARRAAVATGPSAAAVTD